MSRYLALCVVAAIATTFAIPVRAQSALPTPPLSLDAAFERVERFHPDLRVFAHTGRTLIAERDQAAQSPPLTLGVEIENVIGTGAYRGIDGAEATLTLASVLERGGKRAARQALVASRIDALAMQRESKRLDLLAEVARRYLDLAGWQVGIAIADADIAQREQTVAAAKRRVDAGAAPRSVWLSAQAAQARARLERERIAASTAAAWRRLALLWGDQAPQTPPATVGNALSLPPIGDFAALITLLDSTPSLRAFADERRIREAKLELARSARTADVDWQVGVRRFRADDDWALMAGISLPLGAATRAEPGIRAAESDLAALEIEREGSELALYATLADADGRYRAARIEVERFDADVLPALAR
ncbi:MAG: TolC family protein, partial [Rhodospirillaceae bacterium]|nr:TolC family protein [Rhodospirillaceae bacterium]